MTPAVTVIIPTYNYGRFLAGAVESALRQTFTDLEVLVIDDGSTDNTPAVIETFRHDPRFHYERTAHVGAAAAKNIGIRQARAALIAFLDADDLWLPEKLARQVPLFAADPGPGVVYSRRLLMDEQGRDLAYEQPALHRGDVLEAIFRTNFVCFSSAVVRREVLETVDGFDEMLRLAADFDLWLRAAARYRFDYVGEPLVKYRTGHANLSRRVEERLATALRIMRRFLERPEVHGRIRPAVVRRAFADIYCLLGLRHRSHSRWASLRWYLKALLTSPGHGPSWRGLASLPLPEVARRLLRRSLGRPADWSVSQPRSEAA